MSCIESRFGPYLVMAHIGLKQTLLSLMIYLILSLNISEDQIPTQKCQDK